MGTCVLVAFLILAFIGYVELMNRSFWFLFAGRRGREEVAKSIPWHCDILVAIVSPPSLLNFQQWRIVNIFQLVGAPRCIAFLFFIAAQLVQKQ